MTEQPRCETTAWCGLGPGHDGDCALLRPDQVAALSSAVAQLKKHLQELAAVWSTYASALGITGDQFGNPAARSEPECASCEDTGWVDCSADPHCGDLSHGAYCGCPAGIQRQKEDEDV